MTDQQPESGCARCDRPMARAATDECVNLDHRVTDETLGLRDGSCGCCVIVDATALNLLRALASISTPPGEVTSDD